MKKKKMCDALLRSLKPMEKSYRISDHVCRGLSIYVTPSGSLIWRYRWKLNGRESSMTLGEYPHVSLEKARQIAEQQISLVKNGVSPSDARRQAVRKKQEEENKVLYPQFATQWFERNRVRWKEHNARCYFRYIASLFPDFEHRTIGEITSLDILRPLQRIQDRGKLLQAFNVLAYTRLIFQYAVLSGIIPVNPCTGISKALVRPAKRHLPALLTFNDIGIFLNKLENNNMEESLKKMIQFIVLTAVRTNEARYSLWNDWDRENSLLKIPGERMKKNKDFVIPLSTQATKLLEDVRQANKEKTFIFPSESRHGKSYSAAAAHFAVRRMGYSKEELTVHGFRSSFSTLATESALWSVEVIEMCLAHSPSNPIRAVYNRSTRIEERRRLMQWWADKLDECKLAVAEKCRQASCRN